MRHDKEWRAEVLLECEGDGTDVSFVSRWKPFDEWKDLYEPPKQESDLLKQIKTNIAAKAKEALLYTLSSGISNRLMILTLEVSSKLLSLAELEALELSGGTSSNNTIPIILNSINGIILTCRFEEHDREKFEYLRRIATDMLTDEIQETAATARAAGKTAGQTISELQGEITSLLLSKEQEVQRMASVMLDDLIVTVNHRIDKRVELRLEQAEERVASLELAAEMVLASKQMTLPEKASATARETTAVAMEETDKMVHHAHDMTIAALEEKNMVVHQFGLFLKQLIKIEMDKLTVALTYGLGRVLTKFAQLLSHAVELKHKRESEELRNQIYETVESVYKQIQDRISFQVQQVVDMLGALMDHNEEGQDDSNEN